MAKSNWTGRGTNTERGYGYQWRKTRALILRIDKYLCQSCLAKGRPTPATEVHHIKAKADGGDDNADNLMAICHECHLDATAESRGYKRRKRIGIDGWEVEP